MSKGSKRVTVRLPGNLEQEVVNAVFTANFTRKSEPYDVGSWIRAAICEKLNHLKRSRRSKVKKANQLVEATDAILNELVAEGY